MNVVPDECCPTPFRFVTAVQTFPLSESLLQSGHVLDHDVPVLPSYGSIFLDDGVTILGRMAIENVLRCLFQILSTTSYTAISFLEEIPTGSQTQHGYLGR
jgi:hypothetical protein